MHVAARKARTRLRFSSPFMGIISKNGSPVKQDGPERNVRCVVGDEITFLISGKTSPKTATAARCSATFRVRPTSGDGRHRQQNRHASKGNADYALQR